MKRLSWIKRILLGFAALLMLQVVTFKTIALYLLERKLLAEEFNTFPYVADSAFVRDFYVTDCGSGPQPIRVSHNLREKEEEYKKKLHVKYIYFQTEEEFDWDNEDHRKYEVMYDTYVLRLPLFVDEFPVYANVLLFPFSFYRYFSVRQSEYVLFADGWCEKKGDYYWLLFTWVTIGERIECKPEDCIQYRHRRP